jgi:hypothetical protein
MLIAVLSIFYALFAYALISFFRFPPISTGELAAYEARPEAGAHGDVLAGLAIFAAWAAAVMALGHFGHDVLQATLWAGTPIAIMFHRIAASFMSLRCEVCKGDVRRYRKQHERSIPAIVHVEVCPRCKAYRERLVIGISGD